MVLEFKYTPLGSEIVIAIIILLTLIAGVIIMAKYYPDKLRYLDLRTKIFVIISFVILLIFSVSSIALRIEVRMNSYESIEGTIIEMNYHNAGAYVKVEKDNRVRWFRIGVDRDNQAIVKNELIGELCKIEYYKYSRFIKKIELIE